MKHGGKHKPKGRRSSKQDEYRRILGTMSMRQKVDLLHEAENMRKIIVLVESSFRYAYTGLQGSVPQRTLDALEEAINEYNESEGYDVIRVSRSRPKRLWAMN